MDLNKMRVLVTPTSFGKNDPTLKTRLEQQVGEVVYNPTGKPLASEDVARLLKGADAYIAGLDTIDAAALAGADKLKVICRYGVGVDNVDLAAAKARGILVTNTPGANSSSVAELALALMLALARQITVANDAVHKGEYPRLNGTSIEGKTVGIVGLGAIGKQLAKRLSGFDCRLLAYEPFPDREFTKKYQVSLVNLDDLLSLSDFVSLHLPLIPETRGMVNKDFLAKMKPDAYLVNTARGEIIDEGDLADALSTGKIKGVGLDAFAKEPVDPASPLLAMKQVICTPHLGAQTDGATNTMGEMALADCLAVLKGEQPKFLIK